MRAQLIDRANSWAGVLEVGHSVRFLMANATVSLDSMLATYPGPLSLVTIQVGPAAGACMQRCCAEPAKVLCR
jgi:hypothetical protein